MPTWSNTRPRRTPLDEAPTGSRIDPERRGVALVDVLPVRMGLVLGQVSAGEVGVEPREVGLPTGRGLRCARTVVEDVGEDEETALVAGEQVEAVVLAGE